ncbi:unnamed protein product [Pleuronectes platessa]|uniref:Uncharacterized protein n=1 Tax=Pleuronectes platessa TaxID=8262 RepID=A0A9N7VH01_PLEPL|nr:unnamed protein product [Pleuronectes platessa]
MFEITVNRGWVGFEDLGRWHLDPLRLHPPGDLSRNLRVRVVRQREERRRSWLLHIGVSASSWSLHAERDPRWHQGKGLAFFKTSRDWVTSLVRLINRLRPTAEM